MYTTPPGVTMGVAIMTPEDYLKARSAIFSRMMRDLHPFPVSFSAAALPVTGEKEYRPPPSPPTNPTPPSRLHPRCPRFPPTATSSLEIAESKVQHCDWFTSKHELGLKKLRKVKHRGADRTTRNPRGGTGGRGGGGGTGVGERVSRGPK